MLGKLARWLRILGYDTLYFRDIEDWKILKMAKDENRIIITRDRALCNRAKKENVECFMVVPGDEIQNTLALLSKKYDLILDVNPDASRCSECNSVLDKRDKNLWICTKCKKEYWKGKHWETITEILIKAQALKDSYGTTKHRRYKSTDSKGAPQNSQEVHRAEAKEGTQGSQ
nr:Mut7-C RNAse domain-containing protein [Metallosphaera hakonensis]